MTKVNNELRIAENSYIILSNERKDQYSACIIVLGLNFSTVIIANIDYIQNRKNLILKLYMSRNIDFFFHLTR